MDKELKVGMYKHKVNNTQRIRIKHFKIRLFSKSQLYSDNYANKMKTEKFSHVHSMTDFPITVN